MGLLSLNVEPAVTQLTYDVIVTDKNVLIDTIDTYGVKALFYINIDSAPKSKMFDLFDEGLNLGAYSFQGFITLNKLNRKNVFHLFSDVRRELHGDRWEL